MRPSWALAAAQSSILICKRQGAVLLLLKTPVLLVTLTLYRSFTFVVLACDARGCAHRHVAPLAVGTASTAYVGVSVPSTVCRKEEWTVVRLGTLDSSRSNTQGVGMALLPAPFSIIVSRHGGFTTVARHVSGAPGMRWLSALTLRTAEAVLP